MVHSRFPLHKCYSVIPIIDKKLQQLNSVQLYESISQHLKYLKQKKKYIYIYEYIYIYYI